VARYAGTAVGDRALVFRIAAQAVHCAVAVEEASATAIGLHAGEIAAGQAPAAPAVALAGRLATLARAGQVLASRSCASWRPATPTCASGRRVR